MSLDKPFRIMGDVGELHILLPKYAYEVRNNEKLSFTMAAFKWFYAHLPGFEGFREGINESYIMKLVARHQLAHQLTLVTGAVSEECGTTDFFTQVMFDIAQNPELVELLREEVISMLGKQGWSKNSLYNLKLMDSVLKESQRLKPIALASMRRFTTHDVKLSDGVILPKNKLTLVSAHQHWDPEYYQDPLKFDGYRFYNMRREPGKESKAQLVSATPDHMGFGYGLDACPGRFFASEEIKIALSHILLKYDFKPVEGSSMEPRKYGLNMNANPTAKLSVRRRKEEIVI
ncbi:gibberellin cluster-GA14-synthase [Fusarium bulbicola]|nr:gibberellin cluster-GA14-synthase [Fusarium bulbicola]